MPNYDETAPLRISDDEINAALEGPYNVAKAWSEDLADVREKCDSLYNRKEYGTERENFSKFVAPTVFDTVEWLMPSMVDIFTHPDFFSVDMEDGEKADLNKKLLRYQLFSQQKGAKEIRAYVSSALRYHFGILKTVYEETFDEDKVSYDRLSQTEFQQLEDNPLIDIITYEEITETFENEEVVSYQKVKVLEKTMTFRGPRVIAVPQEEFLYTSDGDNLDHCSIVVHRKSLSLGDIKRGELSGMFRKGSAAAVNEQGEEYEVPEEKRNRAEDPFSFFDYEQNDYFSDEPLERVNKRFFVDECYMNLDIDGDGLAEPVIVWKSDRVIMNIERNPYKRPPFRIASLLEQPFRLEGQPLPMILEKDQKEMSALRRLYVDATAEAAYGTMVTDNEDFADQWAGKGVDDVLIAPKNANYDSVRPDQPSDGLLKAMDMVQQGYERTTGVNSLNQGLTQENMGKTATGTVALQNAGQQRQKLYATLLGEALQDSLRDCMDINRMYPPTENIFIPRENITVTPEDVGLDADISIEVGVSPNDRAMKAQAYENHFVKIAQVLIPSGVAGPEHLLKTEKKIAKLSEINVDDLQYSPEELAERQQREAEAQRQAQMQAMQQPQIPQQPEQQR